MSKYKLPDKLKNLLKISYFLLFIYIIFLPFLVYYIYQSVNLAIESSLNSLDGVIKGELEGGEKKIIDKTLLVLIAENFYTTIAGGFLQIVVFALLRLRRPYRHISYKLAFYLSPFIFLFSVIKIILSLSILNLICFTFIATISLVIFLKLLDKDIKIWSQEYLPPPPELKK